MKFEKPSTEKELNSQSKARIENISKLSSKLDFWASKDLPSANATAVLASAVSKDTDTASVSPGDLSEKLVAQMQRKLEVDALAKVIIFITTVL